MKRVISCGFSPNLRFLDVLTSVRSLIRIQELYTGDWLNFSNLYLKKMFISPNVFLFTRAREGEYALLKNLGIGKGDEVIVQAFTCAAVIQPILWVGATPVYVDISERTLSIDPQDLVSKMSPNVKMIILQSTFGVPPDFKNIKKIAKDKGVFLLLDMAHIFIPEEVALYKADAYLLSFGRDKALSSVTGGALIVRDEYLSSKVLDYYNSLSFPEYHEIIRFLLHPTITYLILILFFLHPILGKAATKMYRSSKIVPRPIISELEVGDKTVKKFPNALARLLFVQLNALDEFNKKRIEWTNLYQKNNLISVSLKKGTPLLRVPYRSQYKKELIQKGKEDLIYFGDWYSRVIDPDDIKLTDLKYKKGSCSVAEKVSNEIVNLPSYPTLNKNNIMRVIRSIKRYESEIQHAN